METIKGTAWGGVIWVIIVIITCLLVWFFTKKKT